MNSKSNERRVQACGFQPREACLNRSDVSIALDWSSVQLVPKVVEAFGRPTASDINTRPMCWARNSHFRLLYGFADLPEREEFTYTHPRRFLRRFTARLYTFSALMCELSKIMLHHGSSEEFTNCTHSLRFPRFCTMASAKCEQLFLSKKKFTSICLLYKLQRKKNTDTHVFKYRTKFSTVYSYTYINILYLLRAVSYGYVMLQVCEVVLRCFSLEFWQVYTFYIICHMCHTS